MKSNLRLPRTAVLEDGSYLSVVYPSEKDRRHATNGIQVRVIEYRLQCASCAASCRCLRLFPPQHRLALHEGVLDEILEEHAASSRGRQVPRGVKRKMSSYPLRPRTPQPTTRIDFSAAIRVAK